MPLNYRNRGAIISKYPEIGQAFDDIISHVENVMRQTNVSPTGVVTAPPSPSALTVTASQGIFDAAISDNSSNVARGINYFLEYSDSPAFTAPKVLDLGASRNWRGMLGNQALYFRAYSQYPTSPRSPVVYHHLNGQPIAVLGGGVSTGPTPLPSNGSGTTPGATGSDGGFGNSLYRGTQHPVVG